MFIAEISDNMARSITAGSMAFFIFIVLASFLIYFLPSVIAMIRRHNNFLSILALNFFLGWSVLGWLGALVWALVNPKEK